MPLTIAPRIAATLLVGGGGTAGAWYWYKSGDRSNDPTHHIKKTGVSTLYKDGDFLGIIFDQQENIQKINELKDVVDERGIAKLKYWCQEQARGEKPMHEKFSALCTSSGISSVKAVLSHDMKNDQWVRDDIDYQINFAISKYTDEFLTWINKDNNVPENKPITKDSLPSESFQFLKQKCENGLKKKYADISDEAKYYQWWCVMKNIRSVEEKMAKDMPYFKKRSDWDTLAKTYANDSEVKKRVKWWSSTSLTADDYRIWCRYAWTENIGKDKIYQDKYLWVKKLCVDENSKSADESKTKKAS